jgi:hypothetical protein
MSRRRGSATALKASEVVEARGMGESYSYTGICVKGNFGIFWPAPEEKGVHGGGGEGREIHGEGAWVAEIGEGSFAALRMTGSSKQSPLIQKQKQRHTGELQPVPLPFSPMGIALGHKRCQNCVTRWVREGLACYLLR